MKLVLLTFALMELCLVCSASLKSYENFKVYSITCETQDDVENMKRWELNPMVDFWSLPGVNKTIDVLVHPSLQIRLEAFLSYETIGYEILIGNFGKFVESV